VYWSWNGGPREGRGAEALEKGGQISGGGGAGGGWDSIFENDQSSKVLNLETASKLFEYSTKITGAEWPTLKQITSPCPTLKVIGAVTQGMVKREELKRMQEMGRPGFADEEDESVVVEKVEVTTATDNGSASSIPKKKASKAKNVSKRQKLVMVTDRAVAFVVGNTVGRVARFAGRRILGEVPEEAKTSAFFVEEIAEDPTQNEGSSIADLEGKELLEQAIAEQLRQDSSVIRDEEDEALFTELYKETQQSSEKQLPVESA